MTEFMHEVVARREVTMRRSPVDRAQADFYSGLSSHITQAYNDMVAQQMQMLNRDRREAAIRHAVVTGNEAVTYSISGPPNDPWFPAMETVVITDEMREQYANVRVQVQAV